MHINTHKHTHSILLPESLLIPSFKPQLPMDQTLSTIKVILVTELVMLVLELHSFPTRLDKEKKINKVW